MLKLLLQVLLSIPTMMTSGILLGFFYAPVLCLFWLTKHAVDSALLSAPGSVTAACGGSVTVSCQYDQQFREYTKYWCRGWIYEFCVIVVKTPRNRQNNRSSIRDDKEAGIFTVTMTSLGKSDQDSYWCVIARDGRNVYTRVELQVSPAVTTTTPTSSPTTSSPPTSSQPASSQPTSSPPTSSQPASSPPTSSQPTSSPPTSSQPTSSPPTQDEIRWWAALRWILFISMLCCLVTTHIVAWRMKTAKKSKPHQQFQHQNVYD